MKARNGGKGMTDEQVVAYEISSSHPDVSLMACGTQVCGSVYSWIRPLWRWSD